jgi:hypothetical protein
VSIAAVSTVLDAHVAPDSPSVWRVLVTLADYTDPAGRHAYPSVGTLADRCGFSRSTVHLALRQLEADGLVRRGDQAAAEHLPANRRPTVFDLDLDAIRRTRQGSDHRTPDTLGLGSDRGPTGVRQGSDGERGLGSDSSDTIQELTQREPARATRPIGGVLRQLDVETGRIRGRCAGCGLLVTPRLDRAGRPTGTALHTDAAGRACPGADLAPIILTTGPGDYRAGATRARTAIGRTSP